MTIVLFKFLLFLIIFETSLTINLVNENRISNVAILDLVSCKTSYAEAWEWQQKLLEFHISRQSQYDNKHVGTILMLQHYPVYTLGTATNEGSGPFSHQLDTGEFLPYELFKVERAGQATYHGPGQIVLYPIIDLNYFDCDIHLYLRRLEEVVINTLKKYEIEGQRIPGLTGVWVDELKVAAIGIKLRRWVTMHGLSVNVNPDLRYFTNIIPCGITDKGVGSMSLLKPDIELSHVANSLITSFSDVFDVNYQHYSNNDAMNYLRDCISLTT